MGLRAEDLTAYAPEFGPEFELYWAAVPKEAVTQAGACQDDEWWPDPEMVGLPAALAATHELFPVHPLAARALPAELPDSNTRLILAPRRYLRVRPTLSLRTVAVADHAAAHLKLPLPVSTLGMRNIRSIAPATLADGALVYRLLGLVRERDADTSLAGLLLADDTGYAHAGDRMAGYLLRRLPAGLDDCHVVPVAALAATVPGGRTVLGELAGPDGVLALAERYFRQVFGIAVRLLVRYGIALESHQQNAAVVFSPGQPPRLLVKDFDGALLHAERLRSALGAHAPSTGAPAAGDFADQRLLTSSDDALIDVFITITVHLCVGAICFSLAERGAAPLPALLRTARRALEDVIDAESEPGEYSSGSRDAAALLRARVLGSGRLTGKSMVTAGTLTAKEHTGAADINKYYGTTGPNYLLETR
jgi:siderophore synthetase component